MLSIKQKQKLRFGKQLSLLALMLILSTFLAACGTEQLPNAKDGNYILPVYNGAEAQSIIAENVNFKSVMLKPSDSSFVEQSVQVYALSNTVQVTTVKDFYGAEMRRLGWTNHSNNLIDVNSLKDNGWVQGFIKENRVSGIYMITPAASANGILKDLPSGIVPRDKNILIMTSAVHLNITPAPK